ncbi:putative murein lytic transglycosylase [Halocynthia phage JM-2012]|uniref:tail fiber protein n=1 Tax=Halocynthia phage JM-2012 TaxID=1173297 RepID=UPI00025C691F|nr:tail fiber protein [Halocynthia phage JM-2012]AFI55358.1 putative murein lytic transglycosylase [Halocynthia phage JM-2012]
MSDEEDIKLDDNELDDMDMSFDNLDMEAEEQPSNRDPVTQLKTNFFKGAVTKVSDKHYLEQEIKKAVPKGYSTTYESAKSGLDAVDKAKRNLISPIRKELPEFKRNLNRLSPLVKRMVGDRFGNKFDDLTKVKSNSPDIDPDQLEMQQGLAGIFGTWRESQLGDRQQDMADKMMDAKTEQERFRLSHTTLTSISNSLNRVNAFNDGILLKVHERALELDFKKYHILKNLLKVTTEGYNASIGELKAITKNTGLPEIIKRQNSENFKQLFLDEWQGRTTANIVDFGKDYFSKMAQNIQTRALEVGQQVADGMSSLGDAASGFADMDEMQQEMGGPQQSLKEMALSNAGSAAGGAVSKKVVGFASEQLEKYLKANPDAKRVDKFLQYANMNKAQLFDNLVTDNTEAEGLRGLFFRFIDSVRPTIDADRESITQSLAEKATMEAQWDRMSRETLIKIIPEWLSKIHLVLKQMAFGPKAEKETFDIYSEKFVTQSEAMANLQKRLIDDNSIEDVRDNIDKVIAALFVGNEDIKDKLTQEQIDGLENAIIRSANNDIGTDLDKFGRKDQYSTIPGITEGDAEVLAEALGKVLNVGAEGKTKFKLGDFSDSGGEATHRLNVLSRFKGLKDANPETQSIFNLLNATGNNELLEGLGYGTRDKDGRLGLNFGNLYNRKLGKFDNTKTNVDVEDLSVVRNNLMNERSELANNISNNFNVDTSDINLRLESIDKAVSRIDAILAQDTGVNVTLSKSSLDVIHEAIAINKPKVTANGEMSSEHTDAAVLSELQIANSTLNDVRGVLAEMYAAQQANHNETMGNSSLGKFVGNMGVKFSKILSGPFKLASKAFGKARSLVKGSFDKAKKLAMMPMKLVGGIASEIRNQFKKPDDVYLIGGSEPVLYGKDIARGIYFNRDLPKSPYATQGKLAKTPIKSITDIKGEVFNKETANVAITREEFDKGLETRNPGMAKKIGGLIGKGLAIPLKLAGNIYGLGKSVFKTGGRLLSRGKNYLTNKLNSAQSLFTGDGKLLVTKEELESGLLYVMENGKRVTVTSLKDITSTVYSYKDGEPRITIEQIKEGLRDKSGKLLKLKTIAGEVGNKLLSGAKLLGKVAMSPFKLIGKTTKSLMKMFEGKLISSLLVHVPDNVIFKANVVNLFTNKVIDKGEGSPDYLTTSSKVSDSLKDLKGKAQVKGSEIKDKATEATSKMKDKLNKYKEDNQDKLDKLQSTMSDIKDKVKDSKTSDIAGEVAATLKADKAREKALSAWGKIKKSPRGDSDGDGLRDGGWREQLKDRAKGILPSSKSKDKDGKVDAGSNKIVKTLMMLIGPIVGILGKIANMDILGGLGKAARGLGLGRLLGDVVSGMPDIDRNKPSKAGRMRGKGKLVGRALGAMKSGGGTVLNGTKNLVGKAFTKVGGKKVVGAVAKFGAKKLAGAAVAAGAAAAGLAVIAPIIGIGLAVWTAYEIGSGLWGYFSRRSSIKKIEYLRMMQYGYYVGEDGDYEDRKVALRYFENEMMDRMEPKDGIVGIKGTTEELWEEYSGDFDSSYGDSAARAEWVKWFDYRFKPVLFKWISVVASLNESKDGEHSLSSLDESLKKEQYPDFCKAVMNYKDQGRDPLDTPNSCFTKTPIQAKRKHIESFVNKNILKLDPDKVQGKTPIGKTDTTKNSKSPSGAIVKMAEDNLKAKKDLSKTHPRVGGRPRSVDVKSAKIIPFPNKPNTISTAKDLILEYLVKGDLSSRAIMDPIIDRAIRGVGNNESNLAGILKQLISTAVIIGDHGETVNDWISKSLIPLIKTLKENVGITDGTFNDIDPDDISDFKSLVNDFSNSDTTVNVLNISDGKIKEPVSSRRSRRNANADKLRKKFEARKAKYQSRILETDSNESTITTTSTSGHSSDEGYVSIKDRLKARKAKIAAMRKKYKVRGATVISKTLGGKDELTNRVEIKPVSLSGGSASGTPAPHEITDSAEERIARYNDYIYEASAKTGIDENLIRSVIRQESSGNPRAKSHAGAAGLMQLMPATAKELGVKNRLDPRQSIMGGTEYIRRQLKRFDGVPELALAAYNAGGGNVNKAIRKAGSKDPEAVLNTLPQVTGRHSKETQEYVVKITNDYRKRLGLAGESNYTSKPKPKASTQLASVSPAMTESVVEAKRSESRMPSQPTTTAVNTSSLSKSNDFTNDVERVVGINQEAKNKTKDMLVGRSDEIAQLNNQLVGINYDQLVELKVLNQQMGNIVKMMSPSEDNKTEYQERKETKDLYVAAEKTVEKPKTFQRRVVNGKPPISLDRKIV